MELTIPLTERVTRWEPEGPMLLSALSISVEPVRTGVPLVVSFRSVDLYRPEHYPRERLIRFLSSPIGPYFWEAPEPLSIPEGLVIEYQGELPAILTLLVRPLPVPFEIA